MIVKVIRKDGSVEEIESVTERHENGNYSTTFKKIVTVRQGDQLQIQGHPSYLNVVGEIETGIFTQEQFDAALNHQDSSARWDDSGNASNTPNR